MNIIFDTSTIIAHLLSRGDNNTAELFKLAKTKKITSIICKETLAELKKKLSSEKIKKLSTYKPHINAAFIAWYTYNSSLYSISHEMLPVELRDSTDLMYLKLADVSKADYLITGDNDLLVLKSYKNTYILTPKEFIEK